MPESRCKPKPQEDRRLLSQVRLDRISHPTDTAYRSHLKWFARTIGNRQRYPNAEIKRHLQDELGPEIAELKRLVMSPPETLPAAEWEQAEDRLRLLQGKADALTAVLEIRLRQTQPLSVGGGSEAGSEKTRLETEPANDPFIE
jgi:hypothetical protein